MYAKLVTNVISGTGFSANVYYNTLMDVITGVITSTTSLNSTIFNQAASSIVTTVPAGWTTVDSSANAAGSSYILSGCAPRVISAPWSDSGSNYKYLWTGAVSSTNTYNNIFAYPAEGWNSSTKVGSNIYITPVTTSTANASWHSFAQYDTTPNTGTVTIISASSNHLFVGYNKLGVTYNSNYFWLSEYTRDDPWNTVGNGYPSWFTMGQASSSGGSIAATQVDVLNTYSGNTDSGVITRVLNQATNADVGFFGMANSTVIYMHPTTRYSDLSQMRNSLTGSFGLGAIVYSNLTGNGLYNSYIRDANKNLTIGLAPFKFSPSNFSNQKNNGPGVMIGGSIDAKAPYLYNTHGASFNHLDETTISGTTYTALKFINATGHGTILIKQA